MPDSDGDAFIEFDHLTFGYDGSHPTIQSVAMRAILPRCVRQIDVWPKDRSAISHPQGFVSFAQEHFHA